jgi:DNA-binding MarR family transcriptional regulator
MNKQDLNSAMEMLFYGYRLFSAQPDQILAERKLARVHHRIMYFVASEPGLSVNRLLSRLGVTKQAVNLPLRQLQESGLLAATTCEMDRRVKRLSLTAEGQKLETLLSGSQHHLLSQVFSRCGPRAEQGWREIMAALSELHTVTSSETR